LTLELTPEFTLQRSLKQGAARVTNNQDELEPIDQSLPIACHPGAVPEAQRQRWMKLGKLTYSAVDAVRELADGYALRLPPDHLLQLAEYVSLDRLCCAALRWEIVVAQAGGPVWLKLRGPDGTKAFLAAAMAATTLLPIEVARAAGLAVAERADFDLDNVEELADRLKP
jgi:hypothetical protein